MNENMTGITERAPRLFSHLYTRENCDEITSDATIVVGKHPKIKRFPVDTFLLKIASPKFEELVFGKINSEIRIENVHPSIIEKILRYIYTDKLDMDGAEEAIALFIAAKNYELPHLQSLCNKYLNETYITSHNASKLFEISYKNGFPNILSKSAECLFKKTDNFLNEGGLSDASLNIVEKIVKCAFSVQETILISKVLEWSSDECKRRSFMQAEKPDKRKILENVLPHIHFLCLSNEEFANSVIPSKVLTAEEAIAIVSNKNASELNKLLMPDKFSNKLKREKQYIPLNLHSETPVLEKILSHNDVFSIVFWTERDCFIEGLSLPVIFHSSYQFTMIFKITLTDLTSGIKYTVPLEKCNVRCENSIATFQPPSSLYVKQKTPMKLKVKIVSDPTSLQPLVINVLSKAEPTYQIILKTAKRIGKYEWYGNPIAYIHDSELTGFQISGLLLLML